MKSDFKNNEVEIKNSEIKKIDDILHEICKSICKIIYQNKFGTGFFIKYFLLPNINEIDYINKDIYIVQFPGGNKLSYSEGKIKDLQDYEIIYDASTKPGSSDSPILLKNSTEVIGIHKQGSQKRKENYGTLINSILELILNEEKDDIKLK